jgi:predicted PurR-regulated permease PerM
VGMSGYVGAGNITMAVIQLIYQQVENYVVYPLVYRRAVSLSAFTTIVAVLVASSLLGVVGAIWPCPSRR